MDEKFTDKDLYETYVSRINAVLDYIENNLSNPMTLEELSNVASFSRFHFHRIFTVFMGETLSQFIWRLRLERAAAILVNQPGKSITEIALDCGFSGSSSFSRSFKSKFQLSPQEWKRKKLVQREQSNPGQDEGNSDHAQSNGRTVFPPASLYNLGIEIFKRRMYMGKASKDVSIKNLPETTVAYVRYVGPYAGNEDLFQTLFDKLCAWAGPRNLLNRPQTQYLVIYHDSPDVTEEDRLRMSVCVTAPEDTEVDGDIGKLTIPAGEYVAARFELDSTEYADAWGWVYGQWLPQSGFVPDDRPCFELYPTDVKSEVEGKMVVDIYVPLREV